MKLIVWWLGLMIVLPLLYLWWWRKSWRLILGVTVVAILLASFFIPGEVISSLIKSKIGKEAQNKIKGIDELIKKTARQEVNSENEEKVTKAKLIVKLEGELEELSKQLDELLRRGKGQSPEFKAKQFDFHFKFNHRNIEKNGWVRKWNEKIFSSGIFFLGGVFEQKLTARGYKIEGREVKTPSKNVINFNDIKNKSTEETREKILEAIQEEDWRGDFSIVFFRNLDRISQEVKELLLTLIGKEADANQWEYENGSRKVVPGLSKFIFVASSSNSTLPKELRKNFLMVEVPLRKSQPIIFVLASGIEIIVFFFLVRNQRKIQQQEKLQQFDD